MDQKKLWRLGAFAGAIVLFVLLLDLFSAALTPVFIAVFLAYLLDPVIDRLEARKINRSVAIFILAGIVVVTIGFVGVFLLIQAQRELVDLYHELPTYLGRVQKSVSPLLSEHLGVEIPESFHDAVEEIKKQLLSMDDEQAGELSDQVKSIAPTALKPVTYIVTKATSSTLAFVGWVVGLAIIPVYLFYFLRDWDLMKEKAAEYLPLQYRDYVVEKAKKIDEILGAFIRGQLTICVVLGVLYSLGLMIAGVDMAVVIGMFAGLAFIVPYLGTVIGVVAATVMALLESGVSFQLLGVWAVFIVVQLFEGTLLTPKVMGDKVGLSPVVVIFALMAGAGLFGLLGMLVAVPAAAVIKVFVDEGLEKYKKSEIYLGLSDKEGEGGP